MRRENYLRSKLRFLKRKICYFPITMRSYRKCMILSLIFKREDEWHERMDKRSLPTYE